MTPDELDKRLKKAVRIFWKTREKQDRSQGSASGQRDTGNRKAVTGGKHLDGFVDLCRDLIVEAGISESQVFSRGRKELPGHFRAEKNWDLVVVADGDIIVAIEFKAQVGSFGNNCNNRMEEAIGNATDLWAAYREGAFKPSARPWLGYVFLLEDCEKSQKPVGVRQPHFPVFPEFVGASYARRYELLCEKLLRDRLYDGASLLLTRQSGRRRGTYSCPSDEINFRRFAAGLAGHATAYAKSR